MVVGKVLEAFKKFFPAIFQLQLSLVNQKILLLTSSLPPWEDQLKKALAHCPIRQRVSSLSGL
jgi:hypothetical protein